MCYYTLINHANKYMFHLTTAAFHLGPHYRLIILIIAKIQINRSQWSVIGQK